MNMHNYGIADLKDNWAGCEAETTGLLFNPENRAYGTYDMKFNKRPRGHLGDLE